MTRPAGRVGERETYPSRDRTRKRAGLALPLRLRLLDPFAIGERILDRLERGEGLPALLADAPAELRIACAATREVRVPAGGVDRANDPPESAPLTFLLRGHRLYTGRTQ